MSKSYHRNKARATQSTHAMRISAKHFNEMIILSANYPAGYRSVYFPMAGQMRHFIPSWHHIMSAMSWARLWWLAARKYTAMPADFYLIQSHISQMIFRAIKLELGNCLAFWQPISRLKICGLSLSTDSYERRRYFKYAGFACDFVIDSDRQISSRIMHAAAAYNEPVCVARKDGDLCRLSSLACHTIFDITSATGPWYFSFLPLLLRHIRLLPAFEILRWYGNARNDNGWLFCPMASWWQSYNLLRIARDSLMGK